MMNHFINKLVLGSIVAASTAFGGPLEIFPDGPSNMNSIVMENPPQSASETAPLQIRIHVDCYGTNLRSVSNPLSPAAILLVHVNLRNHGDIYVKFPAKIFFSWLPGSNPTLAGNQPQYHVPSPPPAGWSIGFDPATQYIVAQTQHTVASGSVDGAGNLSASHSPLQVNDVRLRQIGLGYNGHYYGSDAPVSGHFSYQLSQDGHILTINGNFPGQNGFCGGYYSPLMVFFDDKRPKFSGKSQFPLMPTHGWVHWPEPKAPGYFVVLDENKDGKITTASELFSSKKDKNGFESLKKLDSNQDFVLDKRDARFSELQLWKDANGDGVSQKSELIPLSKQGITSFNLKYVGNMLNTIDGRAEARERSSFTFVRNGEEKTGRIIDYWFAPAQAPEFLAAQE